MQNQASFKYRNFFKTKKVVWEKKSVNKKYTCLDLIDFTLIICHVWCLRSVSYKKYCGHSHDKSLYCTFLQRQKGAPALFTSVMLCSWFPGKKNHPWQDKKLDKNVSGVQLCPTPCLPDTCEVLEVLEIDYRRVNTVMTTSVLHQCYLIM